MLLHAKFEQFAMDIHTSLLGTFVSYKENEELLMWPLLITIKLIFVEFSQTGERTRDIWGCFLHVLLVGH